MNINKFKNRLFGRVKGHSKKKINISEYKSLLNKYKINILEDKTKYILDIGTGNGETSLYLSKKYPRHTIVACEKYINGNLNLIKQIEINNITNIKIYPGNVHDILDSNDKKQFLDSTWIFFPDPWPKKKHFKRRLITSEFFTKIYPFINKEGYIYIATDSSSYVRFILKSIFVSKTYYQWINQHVGHFHIKDYYDIETKFYKKAIISGRKPSLFILKKI